MCRPKRPHYKEVKRFATRLASGGVYIPSGKPQHDYIGKRQFSLLDTLAQLPPTFTGKAGGGAKPKETGEKSGKKTNLRRRAMSKYVSNALAGKLAALDSPLKKSYLNSFNCSSFMLQDGNTITSKYCNGRWCLTCNRIRTAKMMNGYMEALEKMQDKHFVTLTIKNCNYDELRDTMKRMYRAIRTIKKYLDKRGIKLQGLRKLECTYNDNRFSKSFDTYHPHFHFIVDKAFDAEALRFQWLKNIPEAGMDGQNVKPCDIRTIKELFKYSTKLVTKSNKVGNVINPVPLDIIYQSMYGLRTFQPMGVLRKIKVTEDVEELQSQVYEELNGEKSLIVNENFIVWHWAGEDWLDYQTGELLTGHKPSMAAHSVANNTSYLRNPEDTPKGTNLAEIKKKVRKREDKIEQGDLNLMAEKFLG